MSADSNLQNDEQKLEVISFDDEHEAFAARYVVLNI